MAQQLKPGQKLLSCPFCGGEARLKEFWHPGSEVWFVECSKCRVNGPLFRTQEDAAKQWNTRYQGKPG